MGNREKSVALVKTGGLVVAGLPISGNAVAVLERAGGNAVFAAEEFFKAVISNEHTRRAYGRIVGRFLSWCDDRGLELRMITPGRAGEYFGQMEG